VISALPCVMQREQHTTRLEMCPPLRWTNFGRFYRAGALGGAITRAFYERAQGSGLRAYGRYFCLVTEVREVRYARVRRQAMDRIPLGSAHVFSKLSRYEAAIERRLY